MSTTAIRRDTFKSFWAKHSDEATNRSMMLNHNADELEETDRRDILSCLPDITNMDAVDIGAGIGRFTTVLADTARWVLSTDFIESFIKKNQERNAHLGNIEYRTGDACHLDLDASSVDLVFTNWLMMYLSDKEVIEFLSNALRWLRPNGHLHLRESCSEPSTARATGTVHVPSETNPTSYRFSSVYIRLFDSIRHCDEQGKHWRFETLWSCSVSTYIVKMHNWRQVHWLLRKVPANDIDLPRFDHLLHNFGRLWIDEQRQVDALLDDRGTSWTDQILNPVFNQCSQLIPKNSTVFVYNPRKTAFHVYVNLHLLAERFTCNVWSVETEPMFYRTALTRANNEQDQRIRITWTKNLEAAIEYWTERGGAFDAFVGLELLTTADANTLKQLKGIMVKDAPIVLLEPFENANEASRVNALGLMNGAIDDVTATANAAIDHWQNGVTGSPEEKQWFLVRANL